MKTINRIRASGITVSFMLALLIPAVPILSPAEAGAELLTVFSENFSGSNTAGDPNWKEVRGDWTVANRNFYVSNPGLLNLARVIGLAIPAATTQTVTAKIKLVSASSGSPNAAIVFNYRDAANYLFVNLTPRSLSLRQKGTFTGEAAGIKSSSTVSAPPGTWHTVSVSCSALGTVTVSFDDVQVPALTHTFPSSSGGGVGLRASMTKALVDYYFVAEDTAGKVPAPSSLAASPLSNDGIRLTWRDNSSTETGFRIERAPGGTMGFTPVAEVGANQTAYTATGLSASTSYSFRVQAYNATGSSTYSNTATASTSAMPNQAPQGTLTLTGRVLSSSSVALSWTNVQYELGYEIYWAPPGYDWQLLATIVPDGTSVTVTDLQPNTEYWFGVIAFNNIGDLRSNELSLTTRTSGNGTLQVLNYTGWNLWSVKVNGVEKLSAGQSVSPGGYWYGNLPPGSYTVAVRVGLDKDYTYYDPPPITKTVTGDATTQHFVTAAELLAGQWYGVQWNTEPWTEHRIDFSRSGAYTRYVKTSATWGVVESGNMTEVNWPALSPIVSFKLSGSRAQSSCGYPFYTMFSNILPGGMTQQFSRQR